MTLEAWRREEGWTFQRLAEALGVTEETARRYCLPEDHLLARFPTRPLLYQIHEITNGQVKPNDFFTFEP